jgi:3-oxoacyl-[acyl-carrier-protein] synthase II
MTPAPESMTGIQPGRRVVLTGMGLRSPIGNTVAEFTDALQNDRAGVVAMPEWSGIDSMRTRVAGKCQGIDEMEIPRKYRRTMGRMSVMAALAARDAIADSGLSEEAIASDRSGISFGSNAGSPPSLEKFFSEVFTNKSLKGLRPSHYFQFMSHTCAANLAMMFRTRGPIISNCSACVSGSQGVGFGFQAIKDGRADLMLSGGAEELHYLDAGVFDIMRATSSKYNDRPGSTPRPFDAKRDGLVVGEGAGCLLLEEYEHARKRGARIWAEVLGFGNHCDGSHLTNPDAAGMVRAMRTALDEAQLTIEDIGHVNAHATGTQAGDLAEASATHQVFGETVPVSSLKGFMGHTLGACGAIEAIATVVMINEGFIAPTRNLEEPDPEIAPLQHVIGPARELRFSIGVNNNFAFGGINTSLVFRK